MLLCVPHKIEERNKQIASWAIISVLERMREIYTPAPFSERVAQLKHWVNSHVDNVLLFSSLSFLMLHLVWISQSQSSSWLWGRKPLSLAGPETDVSSILVNKPTSSGWARWHVKKVRSTVSGVRATKGWILTNCFISLGLSFLVYKLKWITTAPGRSWMRYVS